MLPNYKDNFYGFSSFIHVTWFGVHRNQFRDHCNNQNINKFTSQRRHYNQTEKWIIITSFEDSEL